MKYLIFLLVFGILANSNCSKTEYLHQKEKSYNFNSPSKHIGSFSKYYGYNHIDINDIIVINIKQEDNKDIIITGETLLLSFKTDYNDTENNIFDEDLETASLFETVITDENDYGCSITCSLWKPFNDNIRIFCRAYQMFKNYEQNIYLKSANFTYKDHTIIINCNETLRLRQINYDISFIYANKQTINIYPEGSDIYDLSFLVLRYSNDLLYLYGDNNNYVALDNCIYDKNNVNCSISKAKIEEMLAAIDSAVKEAGEAADDFKADAPLAISKGFSSYIPGKDSSVQAVFRRADKAMYEDKTAYYKAHDRRQR